MPNRNKPAVGLSHPKATEDDVEGHKFMKVTDELARSRVAGEDDVEGHKFMKVTDELARTRVAGDEKEQDVEGHSMQMNPLIARELSRARERDIQKDVKRHGFEHDAREAKKDHR